MEINLENIKEIVTKFERRLSVEVRRQAKIEKIEDKDFKRGELLEKYIAFLLYK